MAGNPVADILFNSWPKTGLSEKHTSDSILGMILVPSLCIYFFLFIFVLSGESLEFIVWDKKFIIALYAQF